MKAMSKFKISRPRGIPFYYRLKEYMHIGKLAGILMEDDLNIYQGLKRENFHE